MKNLLCIQDWLLVLLPLKEPHACCISNNGWIIAFSMLQDDLEDHVDVTTSRLQVTTVWHHLFQLTWTWHWQGSLNPACAKEACSPEQAHQRWLLSHVYASICCRHSAARGDCLASHQVFVKKMRHTCKPLCNPSLVCYYSIAVCSIFKVIRCFSWWSFLCVWNGCISNYKVWGSGIHPEICLFVLLNVDILCKGLYIWSTSFSIVGVLMCELL